MCCKKERRVEARREVTSQMAREGGEPRGGQLSRCSADPGEQDHGAHSEGQEGGMVSAGSVQGP